MTEPKPFIRLYIGNPPQYKFDFKIDKSNPTVIRYRGLLRHWMWRSGVGFGGITTFTAMQLGPWANAVYVLGLFLGVELAMRVDRWAPARRGKRIPGPHLCVFCGKLLWFQERSQRHVREHLTADPATEVRV